MLYRTILAASAAAILLSITHSSLAAQSVDTRSVESNVREAASYVELGDEFYRVQDSKRAIGAYSVALDFAV